MDLWFPIILAAVGCFLQFTLQNPRRREAFVRLHPISGSLERVDRMSWLFIIVGSLWELQNLLV